MNPHYLQEQFARMGARLKVVDRPSRRGVASGILSLDVVADRQGEFFEAYVVPGAHPDTTVLDVAGRDRHLLLMVRAGGIKHKYLCGHDERHWFVAGVPDAAPVGTIRQAKEALKPPGVNEVQARRRLSVTAAQNRKNAAFIRQGEWFFVPAGRLVVDSRLVLQNEPLVRGNGGKPHWAEFCYRSGGELVYVCGRYPDGLDQARYHALLSRNSKAKHFGWRTMRRNPAVFVRGRIRHPDHKTIMLHDWRQVLMNTENQSSAMRNMAFLD